MIFIIAYACIFLSFGRSEINVEPVVEMRWDFSDCGKTGRFGPKQEECDDTYKDSNLENKVMVNYGIQTWTVPTSGLYLITARGPSGLETRYNKAGEGAVISSDFRLEEGEQLYILVGQKSDYTPPSRSVQGPGGSGGTFVTRVRDGYILLVAGGGSASAGNSPSQSKRLHARAGLQANGNNASIISELLGVGGVNGSGGSRGVASLNGISSSAGGAGYNSSGQLAYVQPGKLLQAERPRPAVSYKSLGVSDNAAGVGGFFMFISNTGETVENNGGFGGGGSGSVDGGAGGGGGYSGGGGGPPNGWGGGGGLLNNGENPTPASFDFGRGSVTVTFIGYSCCGPVVVYIAICFVGGILCTIFLTFLFINLLKCIRRGCNGDVTNETSWERNKKKVFSFFRRNSLRSSKPFVSPSKYIYSRNRNTLHQR